MKQFDESGGAGSAVDHPAGGRDLVDWITVFGLIRCLIANAASSGPVTKVSLMLVVDQLVERPLSEALVMPRLLDNPMQAPFAVSRYSRIRPGRWFDLDCHTATGTS